MLTKMYRIVVISVAGLILLATVFWIVSRPTNSPSTVTSTTSVLVVPPTTSSTTSTSPLTASRKKLYVVIDDVGQNLEHVKKLLSFPGILTFSVLPGQIHSAKAAQLVIQAGEGLMLHQPMEAVGGQNPGPGLITSAMDRNSVTNTLRANIAELGAVQGLNNHMGSRGTQDEVLLESLMVVLKEKNLFFLDSRTINLTKAAALARQKGVPCVERDVFLDNEPDRNSITKAFHEGLAIAEKRGYAVMIGHAWSAELAQVLIDIYPQLIEEGYDFDSLINHFLGGKGNFDAASRPAIAPKDGADN